MEVLGIIPARGGSQGIPRKNLAVLLGRPLIAYTCEAALHSRLLTRIIVSTDDAEIAAAVVAAGLEAPPFIRPAELAANSTTMLPVLQHTLSAILPYRPDTVVLLQPTSPLRRAEHIDAAIRLHQDTNADSVVSVVEVPHQFNPLSVMRMTDGVLQPYSEGPEILRRQDKPGVFARNGPAVLVVKTSVIASGRLYGDVVRGMEMSRMDSVDVDDTEDLALAAFYLERRKAR